MSKDTVLLRLDVFFLRLVFGIGVASRSFNDVTLIMDSLPICCDVGCTVGSLNVGATMGGGIEGDCFGFNPDKRFSKSGVTWGPFISALVVDCPICPISTPLSLNIVD
mgnify:CR=1 FL=1